MTEKENKEKDTMQVYDKERNSKQAAFFPFI
jgi:hypothetical protein